LAMSMRSCQRTKHVPMDAEIVTHWPTVFVVVGLTLVFLVGPLAAAIWFTRPAEVAAKETPAIANYNPHANAEQFLPWTSHADLREPVRSVSESGPVVADILPPPLPPPPLPKEVVAEPKPNRPEVVRPVSTELQSAN